MTNDASVARNASAERRDDSTSGGTADSRPFSRYVLVVGGIVFAVLMALSDRYGFQRDELYMVQSGRRLQASYVDQPVLAPLLARVSVELFGLSVPGLRLWAALASGTTVVVGGLTAREFGGGARAQVLAAVAVATMPAVLGSGHVANTTPCMILGCAGLGLVAARIGRTGDARWWLAGGAVAGVGAEDNHLVGIVAVALVIGVLISGGHRLVLNRWFAAGAAVAVGLMIPDLWWQAQHGWATIAMTHALNRGTGALPASAPGSSANSVSPRWPWSGSGRSACGSCGAPGGRCGARWHGRSGCCS